MKVSEMKAGESARVIAVAAEKKAAERLKMLNVYEGARITLVRRAPFGGGVMLEAGGVRLACGEKLAEGISVAKECGDERADI